MDCTTTGWPDPTATPPIHVTTVFLRSRNATIFPRRLVTLKDKIRARAQRGLARRLLDTLYSSVWQSYPIPEIVR
jgi:hypothetical protein